MSSALLRLLRASLLLPWVKLWHRPRFVDKVTHGGSHSAEVAAGGARFGRWGTPANRKVSNKRIIQAQLCQARCRATGQAGRQAGSLAGRQTEPQPFRICNSMLSLHFCVLAFHLWPPRDLHMNEPETSRAKSERAALVLLRFGVETRARARLLHPTSIKCLMNCLCVRASGCRLCLLNST